MNLEIVSYEDAHFAGVRDLWEEAFPDDPPRNRADVSIPNKLNVQPELLIVALDDRNVVGTAMAGFDGHRGWLYAVAVLKSHRRQGIGSAIIREAERRLRRLGCSKINLQLRATNTAVASFYQQLGYAVEERVSMGKLFDDNAQ